MERVEIWPRNGRYDIDKIIFYLSNSKKTRIYFDSYGDELEQIKLTLEKLNIPVVFIPLHMTPNSEKTDSSL